MNKKKLQDEVARIEETQGALRDSIEQTRLLAESADALLQKHKASLQENEQAAN